EQGQGILDAFLADSGRTKALADVLVATRIPEAAAVAARQHLQKSIPWNRREEDEVKLLIEGLEASGGVLPAERMPQDLKPDQIEALASEAKKIGNPVKGELIFRKGELACLTCHAIGGAGGQIGPDLSSLGTSSPAETIIKSLVYPTESIKEGFELQRVVRTDGSELMGYLVADKPSEIVVRDVTGNEVAIPKDNVKKREKIPGSLMPPGLTASLDKQEFIDLVSYLSKLGTSGSFRVPTERFVRRWEVLPANEEVLQRVEEDGVESVSQADKPAGFAHYSAVSGELPISELPVLETGGDKRYSFVRFQVEVLTPGDVTLNVNDTNGITGWTDAEALPFQGSRFTTSFAQ